MKRAGALLGLLVACGGGQPGPGPDNRGGSEASSKAVDVVVAIQPALVWMGNDTDQTDPEGGAVYFGAHPSLVPALEALVSTLPPGSQVAVVIGDQIKQPLVAVGELDAAAAVGDQRDYENSIAPQVVATLEKAKEILATAKAPVQAVIALSDGVDVNGDSAAPVITERVEAMRRDGVLGYAIYFRANPDATDEGAAVMKQVGYTMYRAVASRDDIPGVVGAIGASLGSR